MDKQSILNGISDKEERMLLSSVFDKFLAAEKKGIPVFGDFCTEAQIERIKSVFAGKTSEYGFAAKIKGSERRIPAMNFDFSDIPSDILLIEGIGRENVNHRDVLGSLMSLGIKRCKIGDIIVGELVFAEVKTEIAPYVITNLSKIKNRGVKAVIYSGEVEKSCEFTDIPMTVSSLRADCIISGIARLSREAAKELIASGRVSVNSRAFENSSKPLSEGDIISVRGSGKYLFSEINGTTKKDRIKIIIKKYI